MRRPHRRGPLVALPALACLALTLSACDADDGSTASGSSAATPPATTSGAPVDETGPTTEQASTPDPSTPDGTTSDETSDEPTSDETSEETTTDEPTEEPTEEPTDDDAGTAGEDQEELGAGDVLTAAESGALVRLAVGESAVLRLEPPLQDLSPDLSDPAVVEAVPVQHFADPGYAEYELLGLEAGETTLTVGEDEELVVDLVVDGP